MTGAAHLSDRLAKGDTTSVAETQGYLDRIAALDGAINSYIAVLGETALAAAEASDARRAKGHSLGPLDGVPIAIKDNIDVAGVATTAGIGARRDHMATEDAPVIARLKAAGAIILGKLNMHEGAHGATTDNAVYGRCHNPHRLGTTPGGSSGGSGAALAADLCAAALGTDTLGSIRIPASFCGIAGLKPTRGLVSTRGVVPLCWSLDHVGPMAPRVADLTLMLQAMAGFDAADPVARTAPGWMTLQAKPRLTGMRLGRFTDLDAAAGAPVHAEVAAAYEQAITVLRNLGATIVDVALDGFDHNAVRSKALLMIEADLALIHADDMARDPEGFTEIFRKGVVYGQNQNAPKLAAAFQAVRTVQPVARRVFSQIDALVMPATATPAFGFDEPMPRTITAFTAFANYTGGPAVAVPMGFTADRLPLGLQIVGPEWDDSRVLAIAAAYEATAGHDMTPPALAATAEMPV